MNTECLTAAIRHWARSIILATVVVAACSSVCVGNALAHASLVNADPADGSVVATAPSSFALTFNEPTSPLVLKLVQPDGTSIALQRFVLRDATLDIEAPTGLANGTHVLSWRVISEDGHPVGGSVVFSVGAPSTGGGHAPVEAVDWPVRVGLWLTKVVLYVGLFVGVGGTFFTCWVGGRSRLTSLVAASTILAGLTAALLSIGLQGVDALGLSLLDLTQRLVWTTGLSTSYGATVVTAAAALVAGLVSLRSDGILAKVLSLLALVAIGLALATSGHASTAHPQWLTRPAVFLHAVGIAFWAGSLLPLGSAFGAAFARRASDARIVLLRFSRVIPVAIVPLVAAGSLLALVQLHRFDALWTTAYGQVLLIKLVLLAALFLLAAFNRLWLTEPSARGDRRAILRLRRSIRLELVLVVAIFAVAAVWRFTSPPRALIEAAAAPAYVHIHRDKAMAEVTITPGHVGPVNASIMTMTGDFGPLAAKEVTLVLSNPAAGVEPIRRPATREDESNWRVDGLNLPLPGKWSVRVDILISDFERVKLEDAIEIRP
ncbi:copper resistance CopC/CopD family protein [Pseudochelatococcus sp. B33]